jgi:CDP-diacylglycerol--glycerol-3-phosphate 3-phosphatidyltransferase
MDLLASFAVVFVVGVLGLLYAGKPDPSTYARVERDGGSVLLDKRVMNGAYWVLDPVGDACVRAGVSANMVTLASLFLAVVSGTLLAFGHFGLAAVTTAVGSLGDALDGVVARKSETVSRRGEVLDAAADRYSEFVFLGGLALHYHPHTWTLALTLGAMLGSMMVSYASAKAEAMRVAIPRGSMRRPERAVVLAVGALLVPFAMLARAAFFADVAPIFGELPMLVALAVVAVLGNVSAVRRLAALGRTADEPEMPRHLAGWVESRPARLRPVPLRSPEKEELT